MAILREYGRRVLVQDVDRSIVVGMQADTAGETVELRLALAAFPVNGFAGRHGLESVPVLAEDRPG